MLRKLPLKWPRPGQARSLRDTLLSLGFPDNYSVQSLHGHHDPGMDAVRAAAAFVGLMACPTPDIDITQRQRGIRELKKEQRKRPPREKYPTAIRISIDDGTPMPKSLNTASKLESFVNSQFAAPTAIALCPPLRAPIQQKTHGWICFDTISAMESCVQQLNGFKIDGVSLHLHIDESIPAPPKINPNRHCKPSMTTTSDDSS